MADPHDLRPHARVWVPAPDDVPGVECRASFRCLDPLDDRVAVVILEADRRRLKVPADLVRVD